MGQDWVEWHSPYDEPGSHLHQRLQIVQRRLREAIDRLPAGDIRLVSMCAGQCRDVVGVFTDHPRRSDVTARLVELDEDNVAFARESLAAAGLDRVTVVAGDAGELDAYAGAVPAELVLVCGVFGNITDDDIANTVRLLPQLCAPGATVLWTRHRLEPDLTPTIRGWFGEAGFEELAFDAPDDFFFGVGAQRFQGTPLPLDAGGRLFTFVGHSALRPDPWPPS